MQTYISLLRGINVSGKNMIKMDALRNMYESIGLLNSQTYIQSGNIVFKCKSTKKELLEQKISDAIKTYFGFDVPVIVKDIKDFEKIIAENPFLNGRNEDISKLHVTFLSGNPDAAKVDLISQGSYDQDEYVFKGNIVYLFCPGGYGKTKLSNNFFESKLKIKASTRNWKTTLELLAIASVL